MVKPPASGCECYVTPEGRTDRHSCSLHRDLMFTLAPDTAQEVERARVDAWVAHATMLRRRLDLMESVALDALSWAPHDAQLVLKMRVNEARGAK